MSYVTKLERALSVACNYLESAADTIQSDLDPDDIDGENEDARQRVQEWRALITESRAAHASKAKGE